MPCSPEQYFQEANYFEAAQDGDLEAAFHLHFLRTKALFQKGVSPEALNEQPSYLKKLLFLNRKRS